MFWLNLEDASVDFIRYLKVSDSIVNNLVVKHFSSSKRTMQQNQVNEARLLSTKECHTIAPKNQILLSNLSQELVKKSTIRANNPSCVLFIFKLHFTH